MANLFLDTETCGLHGLPVIVQYAYDDGPISIYCFWTEHVSTSITLIESFLEHNFIGFNISFDWFHLQKMYTFLLECKKAGVEFPDEYLDTKERRQILADCEERGRDGPCIKPAGAFDIMLHARKTEFQMTMNRSDIVIRKVPNALAYQLADKLNETIEFDDILFARKSSKLGDNFGVYDCKLLNGDIAPDFKNIVLKFKASTAMKYLAVHALKKKNVLFHSEVEVDKKFLPREYGYAPFANAVSKCPKPKIDKQKNRFGAWPEVITYHIQHWCYNEEARQYATDDITYTRELYNYFGRPALNDDDSTLAIMVGSVRWRGFAIDLEGIKTLRDAAIERKQKYPTAASAAKKYIFNALSEVEKAVLTSSTKIKSSTSKVILEEIAKWTDHPAGERARNVLDARFSGKEIELYEKLLAAGRFHADFNVIGALSSRMSGASGLNAQGIKKTKEVRSKFPLAFGGLTLCGGDFSGFEVVLADAAYKDSVLRSDLLTCEKCRNGQQVQFVSGIKKCPKCGGSKTMKIHGIFGTDVYPGMTYDEVVATSGTADDRYTKAKSGLFAVIYGGESYTLQSRLGVDKEAADAAYEKFIKRCKGVGRARKRIQDKFCSMTQPGGTGSKVIWREPEEYIESLLGFRRYFTLENKVCKALFKLACDPPKEWNDIKIKVSRRERLQTVGGAVRSALYGAAFGIQSANMRAAANHEIQSSGAQITKHLQRKIWDLQPVGVSEWIVQPINIHDEVLSPTKPEYHEKVAQVVKDTVESFRDKVPLIEMEWSGMKTWADK